MATIRTPRYRSYCFALAAVGSIRRVHLTTAAIEVTLYTHSAVKSAAFGAMHGSENRAFAGGVYVIKMPLRWQQAL